MTDIMDVRGLTFYHNDKKRWLKKPEIFQLGPVSLTVKRGETIAIIGTGKRASAIALVDVIMMKNLENG